MLSVSDKKWQERKSNHRIVEKIEQDFNFTKTLSKLIVTRGFDYSEIYNISNHQVISNIFTNNNDFNKSIELIVSTIKKKEKICIFGDYDVDGSASTALLCRFFDHINHPYFFYIPDREKDGYGPNIDTLKRLINKNPKMIIFVDCGSTSNQSIDFLNLKNIKSIIIDHHEINKPHPKANIIINPKKDNGYLTYDYFCATALTYFFLDLLINKINSKFKISNYLVYVLLATVCDVMPLRKYNRLIAIEVFKKFNLSENIFFREIFYLLDKKNKLNIDDLGYLIGPILNSGGRLGKSSYATELLSSDNEKLVKKRCIDLINLNNKRKKIETLTIKEIDFELIKKKKNNIIVYYNPNINEGLIGIIAARLKDFFGKPSIVITRSGNYLKGSARSISKYNIGRLIKRLSDHGLITKGGGHSMAGGFSLEKKFLKKFTDFVINDFKKSKIISENFYYDSEVSTSVFNKDFYNDISKLEPFGSNNPAPTFLFNKIKILKSSISNDKHIFSILKSNIGFSMKSVAFNAINTQVGEYLLNYKKDIKVVGQINQNFWNNKKTLQLTIKDLFL